MTEPKGKSHARLKVDLRAIEKQIASEAPYHLALGEFILNFARAEQAIFNACFKMTGLPAWEVRALLSGMTLDLLMKKMKLLAKAQHRSKPFVKRLEHFLRQMELLSSLRNRLVHQGGYIDEKSLTSSNIVSAKELSKVSLHHVTTQELAAAANDCVLIWLHCVRIYNRNSELIRSAEVKAWMRGPWLYKSPAPKHLGQGRKDRQTGGVRHRRARQRRSSPA